MNKYLYIYIYACHGVQRSLPAKREGVVMVMLPPPSPLWDVGWTVDCP